MSRIYTQDPSRRPPTFEEARNTRQKVRAAGMHPDYWYPALWEGDLKAGEVKEVVFWRRSIAVYRGDDGQVRAVENRCAHRQLKLTGGFVEGCNLVCPYHGWSHNGEGKVVDIPHSLFGKKYPKFKVPAVPVKIRYGVIWIFPGNPDKAETVALPEIPELEGRDPWAHIAVDYTVSAHHSMVIDNVSDFTHAYLHRRFKPFSDAQLLRYELIGDTIELEYNTKVGRGRFSGLFVDRKSVDTEHMKLAFEYPYQRSNTDDQIKHWLFVRPIDERTTATFYIFYFRKFTIPFTSRAIPKPILRTFLRIAKKMTVGPLLQEDADAVDAEQRGYEDHFDAPIAELNPVVKAFQSLTIRKWQEYLDSQGKTSLKKKPKKTKTPAATGSTTANA
ncbi:MAG: aromatic ring-hydroxylating dioxygenase subunit alpha [Myxococcota bacterium]